MKTFIGGLDHPRNEEWLLQNNTAAAKHAHALA